MNFTWDTWHQQYFFAIFHLQELLFFNFVFPWTPPMDQPEPSLPTLDWGASLVLTAVFCHGHGLYLYLSTEEGMSAGSNWNWECVSWLELVFHIAIMAMVLILCSSYPGRFCGLRSCCPCRKSGGVAGPPALPFRGSFLELSSLGFWMVALRFWWYPLMIACCRLLFLWMS